MSSSAYGDTSKVHSEDDGRFGFDAPYQNNYMQMYPGSAMSQQPPDFINSPYMYDGRGPAPNSSGVWSNSNAGVPPNYSNSIPSQQPGNYVSTQYPTDYYSRMNMQQTYGHYSMMPQPGLGAQYSNWPGAPPSSHSAHSSASAAQGYPAAPTDISQSTWSYKTMGNGLTAAPAADLVQTSDLSNPLLSSQQQSRDLYYQNQTFAQYRTPNPHEMMNVGNVPVSNMPPGPGLDIHHSGFPNSHSIPGVSEMGHNGTVSSASLPSNSVQSVPLVTGEWNGGVEQSFNSLNIRGTTYNSVNGTDDNLTSTSVSIPSASIASRVPYNSSNGDGVFSSSMMPNMNNSNNHAVNSAPILDVTNGQGAFLGNNGGMGKSPSLTPGVPQKKTWASIASQPAKGSAATMGPNPTFQSTKKSPVSAGFGGNATYATPNNRSNSHKTGGWSESSNNKSTKSGNLHNYDDSNGNNGQSYVSETCDSDGIVDLAAFAKSINPKNFDLNPKKARFFVIKSYSEDDIHRSIKYSIWCSTDHGNKKLDIAFKELAGSAPVFLFFSVNGSGHFCGMARMTSPVDYDTQAGVWSQDKWKGQFKVQWIYVKDVPNNHLRHIRLETNENKPVTNSRDATEVPLDKGKAVLKVIHSYRHTTSIFDDFTHYERREEQECHKKN